MQCVYRAGGEILWGLNHGSGVGTHCPLKYDMTATVHRTQRGSPSLPTVIGGGRGLVGADDPG